MELTQTIIAIAQLAFILSSMIGVDLGLRVSEIVEPLRQWRLVGQALLANFVVMPLAAVGWPGFCGWTSRSRSGFCSSAQQAGPSSI